MLAGDRPITTDGGVQRISPAPYISLLQRLGAKSTIQNFDVDNGNFGTPQSHGTPLENSGGLRFFRCDLSKKLLLQPPLLLVY
jgi:hypothetical protein